MPFRLNDGRLDHNSQPSDVEKGSPEAYQDLPDEDQALVRHPGQRPYHRQSSHQACCRTPVDKFVVQSLCGLIVVIFLTAIVLRNTYNKGFQMTLESGDTWLVPKPPPILCEGTAVDSQPSAKISVYCVDKVPPLIQAPTQTRVIRATLAPSAYSSVTRHFNKGTHIQVAVDSSKGVTLLVFRDSSTFEKWSQSSSADREKGKWIYQTFLAGNQTFPLFISAPDQYVIVLTNFHKTPIVYQATLSVQSFQYNLTKQVSRGPPPITLPPSCTPILAREDTSSLAASLSASWTPDSLNYLLIFGSSLFVAVSLLLCILPPPPPRS